ncbi:hypothetical protein BDF20DRAFT_986641 [Mycotypha africana]|uniref:uncharacterized protein n=1 Tax=Mycotypha africana TaxID=64632 RepID=UPI002301C027|nr:uncharacterized protein BDF20DRAFT_986641 [Mycotypha africana]KAI8981592.1 hypothetical protein BDF20DRAFT_986641 [Mycotypha africana]
MLCRKRLPVLFLTILIILCVVNLAAAKKKHKHKKHRHDHDDDDDDYDDDNDDDDDDYHDEYDEYDDDKEEEEEGGESDKPEVVTPRNEAWLKDLDLSDIPGKVRPIGSGICKNAKCDGTDNEKCFETCGNPATPDDIYGCPTAKHWALTFDDGPSNFTNNLLDILDKAQIKATFCVMGAHAAKYPDIIKRAYDAGHHIASHTYSHPHLMSLSNEDIVHEIKATEEVIMAATGIRPTYIRPPYGEADTRVKAIFKKLGYKTLMWNVDPTDYNVHMLHDGASRIQKSIEKIANGGDSGLNAHKDPGYISLQHDLYKTSINQVDEIINFLQNKGYDLMTAAECLGDKDPHKGDEDDDDHNDHHDHHDDNDDDDDDDDDHYEEDTLRKAGAASANSITDQSGNAEAQAQAQTQTQTQAQQASLKIRFSVGLPSTYQKKIIVKEPIYEKPASCKILLNIRDVEASVHFAGSCIGKKQLRSTRYNFHNAYTIKDSTMPE